MISQLPLLEPILPFKNHISGDFISASPFSRLHFFQKIQRIEKIVFIYESVRNLLNAFMRKLSVDKTWIFLDQEGLE